MYTMRANRPMLIAAAAVCGVAVAFLTIAAAYGSFTGFRGEGIALILFFDLVFAYRLYRYVKLIPAKKID